MYIYMHVYIYIYIYKEDELGMIQFENMKEVSYKSPGMLKVWWLIYRFQTEKISI